mmetsp:Transcript_24641/g.76235  ORF Transcript_24641/g.76235 Transcript_24641/m.76235 type:complete len:221 (-) Transcript_24641:391-1053(-)
MLVGIIWRIISRRGAAAHFSSASMSIMFCSCCWYWNWFMECITGSGSRITHERSDGIVPSVVPAAVLSSSCTAFQSSPVLLRTLALYASCIVLPLLSMRTSYAGFHDAPLTRYESSSTRSTGSAAAPSAATVKRSSATSLVVRFTWFGPSLRSSPLRRSSSACTLSTALLSVRCLSFCSVIPLLMNCDMAAHFPGSYIAGMGAPSCSVALALHTLRRTAS